MSDPLSAPTVDGIATVAVTASRAGTTLASLAIDDSATADRTDVDYTAPFVESTRTAVITSSSPTSTTSSASSKSDEDISIGTLVGACVGAFVGAVFIILVGIWLYKRSTPSKRAREPSPGRAWDKLEEGSDTWSGQTKQVDDNVAPMEKLTMFKKSSPSVRTAYTHTESESHYPAFNLEPHPFSQYHPQLAQQMASTEDITTASIQPPYLKGPPENASTISWDSGVTSKPFNPRHVSGAMSPSLAVAISTPSVTSFEPHQWESAEIVNFDGQAAVIINPGDANDSENPFIAPTERRKSISNPFFNATSAHLPPMPKSAKAKGKQREILPEEPIVEEIKNPFADDARATHHAVASIDSMASTDRAIQSLIAALDVNITAEDVQDRLRVASMQPSFVSEVSAYSHDGTELTNEFPMPPNVKSS